MIAILNNISYNNSMDNIEFIKLNNNIRTTQDVKMLNPLVMAFVGDSIYSFFIKTKILDVYKSKVNNLTKNTALLVNAKSQQQSLFKIMDLLNEEEMDIVKRARNTNIHTKAKNYSIEEYRYATALEALLGYLYLSGQNARLNNLLNKIFDGEN